MEWMPDPNALRGRVAVVAGATRGAGRGIAAALGEVGATVVCTGRSTRSHRSEYDRAETIEETAELVTRLGGTGIPAPVDHLDPGQVRALADRLRAEHGRIHVLVNDIWGAERLKGGPAQWNTPIWKLDLDVGLRILRLAVDTHLITSQITVSYRQRSPWLFGFRPSPCPCPFLSDLLFLPCAVPSPQLAPQATQSAAHSCSMIRSA